MKDIKSVKLEYFRKFRLECHYRLDMTASGYDDLPFYIYEGAHKQAKTDTTEEFSLNEEEEKSLDNVYKFFKKIIEEKNHYGEADKDTCKAIEEGKL